MSSMPTVSIPELPRPVGAFVLGTMTFGDTADEEAARRILGSGLDAGITLVDTANGYAGGASEEMLSRLLAGHDDVMLATKAGMPHPDAGDASPLSAEGLRRSLEGSLRRLGRDRVDLFYLHQPDRAVPLSETLGTIAELVAEGRIGALGVSNYAAWQIADVADAARAAGAPQPVVAQQLYNLVARGIEREYAEYAQVHELHTMVYNPLGGGLLTGKHRFDETPGEGRFGSSRLSGMYRERYWNEDLFAAISRLTELADDAGLTPVELAYRWLFSRPVTGTVLLGGSTPGHFEANLPLATAGPLDPDLVAACDAAGEPLFGAMPAYNR